MPIKYTLPRTKSRAEVLLDRVMRRRNTTQCRFCGNHCDAERETCPACRAPLRLQAAM